MRKQIEVGSKGNPNFIEVRHGKMLIAVPRSIFRKGTSAFKPKEAAEFKRTLASRYPWLTRNAIEVVMLEAHRTMESLLNLERGDVERAKALFESGKVLEALSLLEERLREDPNDADAWYLKGEILLKTGRKEDGYSAFARARGHSPKKEHQ